jgi:tetratricopeptide (TPR) repeat protein
MKNKLFVFVMLVLASITFAATGLAEDTNVSTAKEITKGIVPPTNVTAENTAINPTVFIGVFTLVILILFVILGYNVKKLYDFENKKMETLVNKFAIDPTKTLKEQVELFKPDLEGMKGLSRSLMAFAIIFIVGLVLVYSVVRSGITAESVGNLASILAGAVSTIIGFYFGTRAAEEARATTPPTASSTTPPTTPSTAEALNKEGLKLAGSKKYEEAIKCFEAAIVLDPKYAEAWHNKGEALKSLGRTTEADAAFSKAKELGYKG